MFSEPVVYVDIETSGSSPGSAGIIEIGAIRVEDGIVSETYRSFVNPGRPLPHWITNITGITDSDLVQAPYFEDIAYQLHQILDGAIFIAHNVHFDYSFIKKQLEMVGYSWNPKLLCTVRLSRALYPEHRGHSLEKIIARHHIPVSARHRAYDDAKAIKDFSELAYAERGQAAFEQAIRRQLKTPSYPSHVQESLIKDMPNTPGVYVFENEAGNPMYVGKSVHLRNRVLSHFSQASSVSKEMKLSLSTHNVRVIPTESELEALLLESSMVKSLLPVHNKQLRQTRTHFAFMKHINEAGYTTIQIKDIDLATADNLEAVYGVFTSRSKAKTALERLRRTYDLCPKLLSLEKTHATCFLYQLGKCRGACGGHEPTESYNARVETALERTRLDSWPFSTAIMIGDKANQIVVDRWVIIGRAIKAKTGKLRFIPETRGFDLDTYRIIRSYLKTHKQTSVQTIDRSSLALFM